MDPTVPFSDAKVKAEQERLAKERGELLPKDAKVLITDPKDKPKVADPEDKSGPGKTMTAE